MARLRVCGYPSPFTADSATWWFALCLRGDHQPSARRASPQQETCRRVPSSRFLPSPILFLSTSPRHTHCRVPAPPSPSTRPHPLHGCIRYRSPTTTTTPAVARNTDTITNSSNTIALRRISAIVWDPLRFAANNNNNKKVRESTTQTADRTFFFLISACLLRSHPSLSLTDTLVAFPRLNTYIERKRKRRTQRKRKGRRQADLPA